MKLLRILIALACGFFAVNANASIFHPEVNTDGTYENVDFFYVGIAAGYQLAMFDDSDITWSNPLNIATGEQVSFSPDTPGFSSYTATNIDSAAFISLAGNADFMLGLWDGVMWNADNGNPIPLNTAGTAWTVSFVTSQGNIWGVDMTLVPVPAAVWLFGSGLLGLVGVARRRRV